MELAEFKQMSAALHAQEACLSRNEEVQVTLVSEVGLISSQMQDLLNHLGPTTHSPEASAPLAATAVAASTQAVPFTGPGINLASPEHYSGEPRRCNALLVDCLLHFEHCPSGFYLRMVQGSFHDFAFDSKSQSVGHGRVGSGHTILQLSHRIPSSIAENLQPSIY